MFSTFSSNLKLYCHIPFEDDTGFTVLCSYFLPKNHSTKAALGRGSDSKMIWCISRQLKGLKESPPISGWDLVLLWTRDLAPLLISTQ